jgi:hypothetical protein
MLPSLAKVGDTIHFSFPRDRLAGKPISAFEVVVNGKKIDQPEVLITRAGRGGTESANFVFNVTEPGVFQFEITPIAGGEKRPARLNTLEVSL